MQGKRQRSECAAVKGHMTEINLKFERLPMGRLPLTYFRGFREACRGLFQYTLLHKPHALGIFLPAGSHVCPQRAHRQAFTHTIPNDLPGMTALPISGHDTTISIPVLRPNT